MSKPSTSPFGEALRQLMRSQGLSYRELSERTRRIDDRGMTHAHINMLANGREKPSVRAMELLAQALQVPPSHFAEHRLSMAMRELDPDQVGLEQALKNLNARLADRRRSDAKAPLRPARPARSRPTG
jgi:transcriptional regulator with XRE-family HTH domain